GVVEGVEERAEYFCTRGGGDSAEQKDRAGQNEQPGQKDGDHGNSLPLGGTKDILWAGPGHVQFDRARLTCQRPMSAIPTISSNTLPLRAVGVSKDAHCSLGAVLPSLFLVGKDGKCLSRSVQVSTVEDEIKKHDKKKK